MILVPKKEKNKKGESEGDSKTWRVFVHILPRIGIILV
jgi:hypothetical protein